MSFFRPKPGTVLVHDGYRGYVSWLSSLLDRIDRFNGQHEPPRHLEKRLVLGYSVSEQNEERIHYISNDGVKMESISGPEDIDLMLIRRPIIMGCGFLAISVVALAYEIVRKIRC